jgi:hypothetical protein
LKAVKEFDSLENDVILATPLKSGRLYDVILATPLKSGRLYDVILATPLKTGK